MIFVIWRRFGLVVPLFLGLSVLLGFGLFGLLGQGDTATTGIYMGVSILVVGGGGCFAFARFALPHLDKPRPVVVYRKATAPDGSSRTTRHHVTNPDTDTLVTRQVGRSTFYFIPVWIWSIVIAAAGIAAIIGGVITTAASQ